MSAALMTQTVTYLDPSNVSSSEVATEWLSAFSAAITQNNTAAVADLFLEDGFWKDVEGHQELLDARLTATGLHDLCLLQEPLKEPVLQKVDHDLVWLRFCFCFTTKHGKGTAVVYLVPLPDSKWKAYSLLTCLDSLTDFPHKLGPLRNSEAEHGGWEEKRQQETDFSNSDPTVIVIGAGHTGLETAARLKYIGVPTLVIEKKPRVGDSWRDRYKTLCLHDIIFPSTWPIYTPAAKLADWLEGYANVWNDSTKTWTVEVNRGSKGTRTLTVKHLVFATGSGGHPMVPDIPGKASFKGSALHSSEFKSAANHIAHDIAQDFTRSSTFVISVESMKAVQGAVYNEDFPTELADTYSTSLPWAVVRRYINAWAILDGLANVGFKTNLGAHGAGLFALFLERGGGFYIGAGSAIESFTENGLRFADGTELQADVIVFATGYGDTRDFMREVCGDEIASTITRVWGLDEEGQTAGVWRYCGHDGLWFAIGNLALSRFHSLHLALQIKAIEEGILNKADVVI
ncbi:hypothetical protein BDR07DRAFT_1450459 [Suillus spraguei]|nr:hypothetical protein BDR07DRAFT_1450459 [Suillus spraguei]